MAGDQPAVLSADLTIAAPTSADGKQLWRLAQRTPGLDVNSPYAYVLWCSQFSATSAIARIDDEIVGFVAGLNPPGQPETLLIRQIAVADQYRGRGIGLALLESVVDRMRPRYRWLKAVVGRSNVASAALFTAFADEHCAILSRASMFSTADFPDPHEPEDLYVVGPLSDGIIC